MNTSIDYRIFSKLVHAALNSRLTTESPLALSKRMLNKDFPEGCENLTDVLQYLEAAKLAQSIAAALHANTILTMRNDQNMGLLDRLEKLPYISLLARQWKYDKMSILRDYLWKFILGIWLMLTIIVCVRSP